MKTISRVQIETEYREWGQDKYAARFWGKVERGDGCWIWRGSSYAKTGYGQAYDANGGRLAHRMAYELVVGKIPDGLTLDHLCRTRLCVNPSHLEPVTRGENTMRGDTVTAKNKLKTACPKGHPYDKENTLSRTNGRRCRACHAEWNREYMATRRKSADRGRAA